MNINVYRKTGKRVFDVFASAIGLLVLSPLLLCTAVAVSVRLGHPIIFSQVRPGMGKEPFRLYKFRTMTDERDDEGNLLSDGARITKFGSFLRATSLDELPELFNILKGEMSLVGPRPLLMRYLPHFTHMEEKRFEVRPGLTGLAQINGRNSSGWNERLAYDVEYVEDLTFKNDLKILIKTLGLVGRRDGVVIVPGSKMLDLDRERESKSSDD